MKCYRVDIREGAYAYVGSGLVGHMSDDETIVTSFFDSLM